MEHVEHLTCGDTRSLLKLLSELHDWPAGSDEWLNHLGRRLCDLASARVAMIVEVKSTPDGRTARPSRLVCEPEGAWSESVHVKEFFANGVERHPAWLAMSREDGRLVTRTREELVGDEEWRGSAEIESLRRDGRVDEVLCSVFRLDDGAAAVWIALHRGVGEPGFGARERALLDVLHGSLEGVYRSRIVGAGVDCASVLPQRVHATLRLLLEGRSEKEIADRIGLTHNTVHSYVKVIHKRLGVRSRGELLAKCLGGGRHSAPGAGNGTIG